MSLKNIRLWEGSQERAFGELCFQLEYSEDNDSKTVRNAALDGGIEFYKVLNGGREWGYQCKYFLKMGDSQWVQMDSSVKRAIATHQSLVKYVFMLPIDFPDPRIHRKKVCSR